MSLPHLGVAQSRVFHSKARRVSMVAGRRCGKTTLIGVRQFRKAYTKEGAECRVVFPTYKQGKDIFWRPLKAMIDPCYVAKKNESELSIMLHNGSQIKILGADNPDSLRGPGLDLVDFDEYADIDPVTWTEVLRPALADREGDAGFFGTPKGYDHFYDNYVKGGVDPEWASFTFTTAQGGRVKRSEIEAAREELDTRVFRQEFEASFETLQGRVYANFARAGWPVGNWFPEMLDLGGPLYVGMDFNINPMSAVIVQEVLGWPEVLDEVELFTSNTEEMCQHLRRKYGERRMIVTPDASGVQGHSSSPIGQTDLTILRSHGFELLMDRANPPVVDRVNNVQSLLLSGTKRRRLRVHPRCKRLTKCLEGLTWEEGTNKMDKKSGLDHLPDALGYTMWQKWNVLGNIIPAAAPKGGGHYSPYGTELSEHGG